MRVWLPARYVEFLEPWALQYLASGDHAHGQQHILDLPAPLMRPPVTLEPKDLCFNWVCNVRAPSDRRADIELMALFMLSMWLLSYPKFDSAIEPPSRGSGNCGSSSWNLTCRFPM